MGVNCNINLPLHVNSERVLMVISKIVGAKEQKQNLSSNSKKNVDFSLPSSEHNSWYIQFDSKLKHNNVTPTMLSMQFTDVIGQEYSWYYHLETEYENYKTISPSSSPIAIAVGQRLIRFFGGKLIPQDQDDNVFFECKKPKLKRHIGTNTNDTFYNFFNLLDKEPILTPKEISDAMGKASYPNEERSLKLLHSIEKVYQANELDKLLPNKSKNTNKNLLKV